MKRPIPNSYWVEPGRLLAGEHPDGGSAAATRTRIDSLLSAGVRCFIDLTEPHEIAAYASLLPAHVSYESHSMPDHSVPRIASIMRGVQIALERRMAAGVVYVHCRAGIGRTGMAVGCYLREQGESAQAALAELNRLWQQNARAARWPTVPETEEQEDYIRRWQPHPLDAARSSGDSGLHRLTARPLQRYRGCLVGLAIGDVVASAPEGHGSAVGWTDDTAMTLCVAESLLACDGFDGRHQLERYRNWASDPVAAGAAPGSALRPVVREVLARAVWSRSVVLGSHDPAQVDPAPLARCAAPAMFAMGRVGMASELGADVARVTHQAAVLVDACRLFTGMIAAALGGCAQGDVLKVASQLGGMPLRDDVQQLAADWIGPQLGRRKSQPGVLGALDRAVRCFSRSRSFSDGLERAAAGRGADRDAVCSAYGALAGAYYGEAAIPQELRARVAQLDRLEQLAERLFQHASAAG
jgi:ADP-ribosylglycohydrolase